MSDARIDAVVVAYSSADSLRGCVEPLASRPGVSVTIVDNASPTDDAATVADLPVHVIRAAANHGFGSTSSSSGWNARTTSRSWLRGWSTVPGS
jgi:GT2 family glycosyltransferase